MKNQKLSDKEYIYIIDRLKKARLQLKLNQGEVAKKVNEYSSYLSKVENNSRELDIFELLDLCLIYNLKLKDILPERYYKLLNLDKSK